MVVSIHEIEERLLKDIELAEPKDRSVPVDTYRNFMVALSLRKDSGES